MWKEKAHLERKGKSKLLFFSVAFPEIPSTFIFGDSSLCE